MKRKTEKKSKSINKKDSIEQKPLGLFNTWKTVMFDPLKFYEKLSPKIMYKEPSIFYLKIQAITLGVIYFIGLLILAVFALIFISLAEAVVSSPLGAISSGVVGIIILIALLTYPVILLFSWGMLFVSVGITHLFVLMFGGKQGYVETFKTVAYSMAPQIFCIIPLVGWAAMIYMIVLQTMGIKLRQKLSWGKSVAVILLPMAILLVLFLVVYFLFIFSILSASMAATATGGLS